MMLAITPQSDLARPAPTYGDAEAELRRAHMAWLAAEEDPRETIETVKALYAEYLDAIREVEAIRADLRATDDWIGCRPKRQVALDRTGGRLRCDF